MFGFVHCNESILARQNTDPRLFFVRTLVKNWIWPIITCFGVTGNILAIIVLTKRRMIMSSTNNYLAALALVDIAYLTLTLILNTSQHPCFTSTSLSAILLTICRPIADFSSNTSVWLTVTFTVERWVAITYPLQSRTWCTVSRARRIIVSVMCAALICTSPSAFEMKLVRAYDQYNVTAFNETRLIKSRIRAKSTALGESILYHQIYFNFVTFAIIWIPLLFLVIFNTILIVYVHRSKLSEQKNSQGIQLRRHNQGNQGEQRKTTIMLIAVVIVFTVCQIPQAISLTVQSFFPVLSQSPKVLIYNNFANCLVALNASINFLLYCCFSDRFRSTFSSNFTFLTKYCAPYLVPHWKLKIHNKNHSITTDSTPYNYVYRSSNGSQLGKILYTRTKNLTNESNFNYVYKSSNNSSPAQSPLMRARSRSRSLSKSSADTKRIIDLKKSLNKQTNEMYSNPAVIVNKRVTSSFLRQSLLPNVSIVRGTRFQHSSEKHIPSYSLTSSVAERKISSKQYSSSMYSLNQSSQINRSTDKLNKKFSIQLNDLNRTQTFHSQQSLHDHYNEEVWIKRPLSKTAVRKNIEREDLSRWKDIIDVTV